MRQTISISLLILCPIVAFAGGDAKSPAKIIAPFVDEQTFIIVRIQPDKVKLSALSDAVKRLQPDVELEPIQGWLDAFAKAQVKEVYAGMSLSDPFGQPFAVIPLGNASDVKALKPALATLPEPMTHEVHKGVLLIGAPAVLRRLRGSDGRPRAELDEAFTAVASATVQVVGLVPPLLRRSLRETMPRLPQELGGGSTEVLDKGIRWGALGIDLPPDASIRLTIQSEDANAAKAVAVVLSRALAGLAKEAKNNTELPDVGQLLETVVPKVEDTRVHVEAKKDQLTKLLTPAVDKVRLAAQRAQTANNLKQFALAMHSYHDVHKTFPPRASFDAEGKALLSWRVHVLPFLDQEALYKEFHLNEPWDSAHNKKLIARMPKILRSPLHKDAKPGMTTYLVPTGKDTIFAGPKGVRVADISDGTSLTILMVDANDANAVIWTRPEDFEIATGDARARLLRLDLGLIPIAFADGSVRFLPRTIDRDTLQSLFLRNDGKAVNLP